MGNVIAKWSRVTYNSLVKKNRTVSRQSPDTSLCDIQIFQARADKLLDWMLLFITAVELGFVKVLTCYTTHHSLQVIGDSGCLKPDRLLLHGPLPVSVLSVLQTLLFECQTVLFYSCHSPQSIQKTGFTAALRHRRFFHSLWIIYHQGPKKFFIVYLKTQSRVVFLYPGRSLPLSVPAMSNGR